jgi:hypothetical protein
MQCNSAQDRRIRIRILIRLRLRIRIRILVQESDARRTSSASS